MPMCRLLCAFHPITTIHRVIFLYLRFLLLAILCAPSVFAVPNAVPYIDIVAPVSFTPV